MLFLLTMMYYKCFLLNNSFNIILKICYAFIIGYIYHKRMKSCDNSTWIMAVINGMPKHIKGKSEVTV